MSPLAGLAFVMVAFLAQERGFSGFDGATSGNSELGGELIAEKQLPMTRCDHCGEEKPRFAIACELCGEIDSEAEAAKAHGPRIAVLAALALLGLSVYRFWILGWVAWSGNLRAAALVTMAVALVALLRGHMWLFGIRSRRAALVTLAVVVPAYLVLNQV